MTAPETPEYSYTVCARTADGREAAVTFGPVEGAVHYAEYWTGPSRWWKRAWRRTRGFLTPWKDTDA